MGRWIKTSEQMPPEHETVLGFNPKRINPIALAAWTARDDIPGGALWNYDGSSGGGPQRIRDDVPLYWMPLPKPPESEKGSE